MDWQERIISLYLEITELSQSTLQYFYQRFSNNNEPAFTDEEIITIYLFGIQQGYTQVGTEPSIFHIKCHIEDGICFLNSLFIKGLAFYIRRQSFCSAIIITITIDIP